MFGSPRFYRVDPDPVHCVDYFGAGKLPQLGEGIGKAIKGFKSPSTRRTRSKPKRKPSPGAAS